MFGNKHRNPGVAVSRQLSAASAGRTAVLKRPPFIASETRRRQPTRDEEALDHHRASRTGPR